MSPALSPWDVSPALWRRDDSVPTTSPPTTPAGLVTEAWSQGFMVGSLLIMSCITMANMRRRVLLHKLILIELIFGIWHGVFIFFSPPVYNWWLSISAIFLNASWSLHNVIAWMKNRPFLSRKVSLIYIGTVILVQPYWVLEIYANFAYFHDVNTIFLKTRPLEALFRDPWWIFTTVSLFYNIKRRYELSFRQIVRLSPRFAVMLVAMVVSICFLVVDICSVTGAFDSRLPVGINPFWKLSFVFKCLTDSVVLDDFKTALDRLHSFQVSRLNSFAAENADHGIAFSPGFANGARNGSYGRNEPKMPAPSYDGGRSSSPDTSWMDGNKDFNAGRKSSSSSQAISPVTRTSSEAEIRRHMSHSPASQSYPGWRGDSLDGAYGDAIRELTHTGQSGSAGSDKETTGVGRAM